MPTFSGILHFVVTLFAVQSSTTINISIPAPNGSIQIPRNLIGFSLEQDRWVDWAGLDERNQFFFNVLDNMKAISGEPPIIRIGANSEDHTNFNPDVKSPQLVFPTPNAVTPFPEARTIVVGNAYYQAVRFLPPDTHVVWGVNFGAKNITAANLEARAIVEAFATPDVKDQGIILDAVEIGNEADLYRDNGQRPRNYTPAQYVEEWTEFATNVSTAIGITEDSHTKFWGASFATSSHANTNGFSPQSIFENGLLDSKAGSFISTITQHHYSGTFCSGGGKLLQDLMTKETIRSNLTSFASDAKAVRDQGLDFVMGETNSYSCHGAPGVSNSAGAALWTLDYALFSTQIQSSRIYFHEGIGFKYNFFQPIALNRSILDASPLPEPIPPHVQPQYYSAIIALEAIGSHPQPRIAELQIEESTVSGYAFYEDSQLVRAVFINLKAFLEGQEEERSKVHLKFDFVGGEVGEEVTLKRLDIAHADDTDGLTWGGQSYETSDGRVSGTLKTEKVKLNAGFDIRDTEVVLVTFS
ncbi:hypothetical protein AGABI2DRAFT_201919 [Agaricus bisporus var. bisporus H97]|uniref:hypothetical protein n=1 Tax=Agaricus bisporus var. bisporus (strain H97 / ATCC MYA-4626 / FGSC 10389) TaxID=936046 RepID=UPI00029F546D|nr:hypothetical protein AGABI2DRAFT_201919 [Agaricus bisporus var. bisporus H97]EKV49487.1 hypothetical protein AGABI2DRAFT_201919 [Agaricus bisporus var. bisporus H97]